MKETIEVHSIGFFNPWIEFADFRFRSQMMDHGDDRFILHNNTGTV
jgi:hypothetical protein